MTGWRKMIYWKLYQQLNFDIQASSISIRQNISWKIRHKILWSPKRSDLVVVNKKQMSPNRIYCFYRSVRIKESKKIPGPYQKAKRIVEDEGENNIAYSWSPQNNLEESGKETGDLEIKRKIKIFLTTC